MRLPQVRYFAIFHALVLTGVQLSRRRKSPLSTTSDWSDTKTQRAISYVSFSLAWARMFAKTV
jgi:hypothetical protein